MIIPVFVPHGGCPHRCVFCNQSVITGASGAELNPEELQRQVNDFLAGCRQTSRPSQIAFYGGNFLGLPSSKKNGLLSTAARLVSEKKVDGIRFSTRPDTIDSHSLAQLSEYPVQTIEIGVQSMDDRVLELSRRGHTAADTVRAADLVKESGFQLGLQIMTGLPGDHEDIALETARQAASLCPDFIRIYPTVVVTGSRLAAWHRDGSYTPWPLDRAVSLVMRILLFFQERKIPVIRMGLQASEDLREGDTILAGPYHPSFGHLVYTRVFLEKATKLLTARAGEEGDSGLMDVVLRVHPRSESRLRGMKNENLGTLKKRFGLNTLTIERDGNLPVDEIQLL